MRWDIVTKAWDLAKNAFPSVKRIYVDLPQKFSPKGTCSVFDLENRDEPVGGIEYSIVAFAGKPTLVLALGDQRKMASLERCSLDLPVATGEMKPLRLGAKDVLGKCASLADAGEKAALLAAGHPSSPLKDKACVEKTALRDWMVAEGFPEESLPYAQAKLQQIGVSVQSFNLREAKQAKHKKRHALFQPQMVLRVIDPNMRDHNKCGKVVSIWRQKRKKVKGQQKKTPPMFWYLIWIDGTSKPVWFAEKQLAPNMAGALPMEMPVMGQGGANA